MGLKGLIAWAMKEQIRHLREKKLADEKEEKDRG